jgi:hypothetical protein
MTDPRDMALMLMVWTMVAAAVVFSAAPIFV